MDKDKKDKKRKKKREIQQESRKKNRKKKGLHELLVRLAYTKPEFQRHLLPLFHQSIDSRSNSS